MLLMTWWLARTALRAPPWLAALVCAAAFVLSARARERLGPRRTEVTLPLQSFTAMLIFGRACELLWDRPAQTFVAPLVVIALCLPSLAYGSDTHSTSVFAGRLRWIATPLLACAVLVALATHTLAWLGAALVCTLSLPLLRAVFPRAFRALGPSGRTLAAVTWALISLGLASRGLTVVPWLIALTSAVTLDHNAAPTRVSREVWAIGVSWLAGLALLSLTADGWQQAPLLLL